VGEAHTQGKSRVSHRPLRQGRHAGRCGAAGARTVRARAVVACASVQECHPTRTGVPPSTRGAAGTASIEGKRVGGGRDRLTHAAVETASGGRNRLRPSPRTAAGSVPRTGTRTAAARPLGRAARRRAAAVEAVARARSGPPSGGVAAHENVFEGTTPPMTGAHGAPDWCQPGGNALNHAPQRTAAKNVMPFLRPAWSAWSRSLAPAMRQCHSTGRLATATGFPSGSLR